MSLRLAVVSILGIIGACSVAPPAALAHAIILESQPRHEETVVAPAPVRQTAYLFDAADPDIWAAITGKLRPERALNEIAYSWKQLGAGNLVTKYAVTPGTPPAGCQ